MPASLLSRVLVVVSLVGLSGCGVGKAVRDELDDDEQDEQDEPGEEVPYDPCLAGELHEELRSSLEVSPISARLNGVVVVQGVAVAVGGSGTILVRDEFGTWERKAQLVSKALNGVAQAGDTTEVFAVGDGGVVLHSKNSGAGWAQVESGTEMHLRAVTFLTDDIVVAVGDGVLRSGDRGVTWTAIEVPVTGLRAVTTVPYLLAVGDAGVAIRSYDAGKSWEVVDVATDRNLTAVAHAKQTHYFAGDEDYFVVAGEGGLVRKAVDMWQDVEDVEPANTFHGLSRDGRWLVGTDGEIRVNVDEGFETIDYTVFESPTDDDLLAVDGGLDWAVMVGELGSIVWIETAQVTELGVVCP